MSSNKYLIKTDVEGLMKDKSSGAVLNVDNAKLEAYKKQKKTFEETDLIKNKMKKIDNDITEIKNLLAQLIGNKN